MQHYDDFEENCGSLPGKAGYAYKAIHCVTTYEYLKAGAESGTARIVNMQVTGTAIAFFPFGFPATGAVNLTITP